MPEPPNEGAPVRHHPAEAHEQQAVSILTPANKQSTVRHAQGDRRRRSATTWVFPIAGVPSEENGTCVVAVFVVGGVIDAISATIRSTRPRARDRRARRRGQ